MATTTTTTVPRTPRSFRASQPPTSALPALPGSLTPKSSLGNLRRSSLLPQTRSASGSFTRPPSITTKSATPTQDGSATPSRLEPRRTISLASFPHPPKAGARVTSLPPSPLGAVKSEDKLSSPTDGPTRQKSYGQLQRPKTVSVTNMASRYSRDSGVAFLPTTNTNGSSEYLSPPHSRSSSAQDSYSTSATTVDAPSGSDDSGRGRSGDRPEPESKGNVIISVRVRPDGPEDGKNQDWTVSPRDGRVGYRGKDGGTYEYDNVFSQSDNNARVYESCAKRLVRRVMEGYHATVFAYGMTGTGKTFSMQGTTSSPGVIPLAITDIFSYIRETPHREFLLRVSYLEIYNERIHDLLATQPDSTAFVPLDQQTKGEEIKLREDPKRGVYATPLKEEIVQSPTQLLRVIARGDLARRTGSTQYNARSSRSHAVVQIVVESRDRVASAGDASMADNRRAGINGGVRVSTLSLIDLAGSERAAENKERRTEGAHINRSLLTLGTVIARLSKDGEGGKDKDGNHLPYRDSKLTRLLQPALSGNSLISILCTIAIPSGAMATSTVNIGETVNTLKFAARARNNISSHAKKADESFAGGIDAGSKALLEKYRAEIVDLRRELEGQRRKEEEDARERDALEEKVNAAVVQERHGEQLLEMQLARTALKERIEHLNRLILCSKSSGVNSPRSSMINNINGNISVMSMRSSAATPMPRDSQISNASSMNQSHTSTDIDEESGGEFADGIASLAVQNRALRADLADKDRYIQTLEKRLLQARRSSQSRTSFGISGSPHKMYMSQDPIVEGRMEVLLKEKDDEIADLRARLDDKERMVSALRSAARKRDMADVSVRRSASSESDGGGIYGGGGGSRFSSGARLSKASVISGDSSRPDINGTF